MVLKRGAEHIRRAPSEYPSPNTKNTGRRTVMAVKIIVRDVPEFPMVMYEA